MVHAHWQTFDQVLGHAVLQKIEPSLLLKKELHMGTISAARFLRQFRNGGAHDKAERRGLHLENLFGNLFVTNCRQ